MESEPKAKPAGNQEETQRDFIHLREDGGNPPIDYFYLTPNPQKWRIYGDLDRIKAE